MRISLILFMLTLSLSAVADVLKHETFLSNHFTDVLKSYDERGVVRVDIKVNHKQVRLPGSNFIVNTNIIESLDKKNISGIDVNVFTQLEEVPSELKKYIEEKTKNHSVAPKLNLFRLSKKTNQFEKDLTNEVKALASQMAKKDIIYVLLLIPFAMLVTGLFFRKQMAKATEALDGQFNGLVAALQEQGIGTGGSTAVETQNLSMAKQVESNSTVIEENTWEAMGIEFYRSLLADCYWCEEDRYAAFIWSKVPVSKKKDLLEVELTGEHYVNYITELNPEDKGIAQHSYYLNPISMNNVSNQELTKLILEDKRIFNYLSPLRLKHIELSLEDKLECIKLSNSNPMQRELVEGKVAKLTPSIPRVFEVSQTFEFASEEEEIELLEMDVDFSIMKKFPSLGWILKLEDEKVIEIISVLKAKDFAGALCVPEKFKEEILGKLPEKRRELVESYGQKVKASRNQNFTILMDNIYKGLEEKYLGSEGQDQKAA